MPKNIQPKKRRHDLFVKIIYLRKNGTYFIVQITVFKIQFNPQRLVGLSTKYNSYKNTHIMAEMADGS